MADSNQKGKTLNDFFRKGIQDSKSIMEQLKSIGYAYYKFGLKYPGYADILHNIEYNSKIILN